MGSAEVEACIMGTTGGGIAGGNTVGGIAGGNTAVGGAKAAAIGAAGTTGAACTTGATSGGAIGAHDAPLGGVTVRSASPARMFAARNEPSKKEGGNADVVSAHHFQVVLVVSFALLFRMRKVFGKGAPKTTYL